MVSQNSPKIEETSRQYNLEYLGLYSPKQTVIILIGIAGVFEFKAKIHKIRCIWRTLPTMGRIMLKDSFESFWIGMLFRSCTFHADSLELLIITFRDKVNEPDYSNN